MLEPLQLPRPQSRWGPNTLITNTANGNKKDLLLNKLFPENEGIVNIM